MNQENNEVYEEDLLMLIHQSISNGSFDKILKDCIENIYDLPAYLEWKDEFESARINIILNKNKENIREKLNQIGNSSSDGCNTDDFDKIFKKAFNQMLKDECMIVLKSQMKEFIDERIDSFFKFHEAATNKLNNSIPDKNNMACDKLQKKDGKESNSIKKDNSSSLCKEQESLDGEQNGSTKNAGTSSKQIKNVYNNKRSHKEEKKSTSLCKKSKLLNVNQNDNENSEREPSTQTKTVLKNKSSSSQNSKLPSNNLKSSRKDIGSTNIVEKSKEKSSVSKNNSSHGNILNDKEKLKIIKNMFKMECSVRIEKLPLVKEISKQKNKTNEKNCNK